ncbi:SecDF P1 head subdomain-containing protein [Arenimonas sp.]|uniref:SecDF P1 head subdomain-containing protein n=1 Tax=Arenimonas sp. TaxID=1872635 RepID=UPI0039C859C3
MLPRSCTPVAVATLLAVGCAGAASDPTLGTAEQLARFLEIFPLSVHPVDSAGKAGAFSIVRSEHVEAIASDRAHAEGELAVLVHLNEEGGQRMLRHTTNHVGAQVSVQCDGEETSRPVILEPFSSPFRVLLAHSPDPN